jgi:hypothetical protein
VCADVPSHLVVHHSVSIVIVIVIVTVIVIVIVTVIVVIIGSIVNVRVVLQHLAPHGLLKRILPATTAAAKANHIQFLQLFKLDYNLRSTQCRKFKLVHSFMDVDDTAPALNNVHDP